MDLYKAIQDLYAEKEKLERVIASLEELQRAAEGGQVMLHGSKRRGRKSMGDGERAEVSERMKKYWAGRRKEEENHRSECDSRANHGSQSASLILKNHSQ
ncbi:MAG: hypothetical protein ABSH40_05010 [Bryobacteraceae bacterium]|jgi:hypothetical protein